MRRLRFRITVLGLCALALGVLGYSITGAQGETGAAWMINGSNISGTLKTSLKGALENEVASLLTTVTKVLVKILCKQIAFTTSLGLEGSVKEGKVQLSGCATFLNGSSTANAACLPKSAGVNDIIETNAVVGLLVLVGGVGEILLRAAAGAEKSIGVIESSEECAAGQKMNITGELLLKDCQGKIKEELVTHLFEADNTASTLKASGQSTTLDGSINLSLGGEHAGLQWSGLPA